VRVHLCQREAGAAGRGGRTQRPGPVRPHHRADAVEARQRLAHPRAVEDPRPERRDRARPDVHVHEPRDRRALVVGEHRRELAVAKMMEHAGRDDHVGRLLEAEGVRGDEPARQPLLLGEPLRGDHERAIAVGADQLHVRAEAAVRGQPAHDEPQAAAEIDDTDRATPARARERVTSRRASVSGS
jgi:hypothetical protein